MANLRHCNGCDQNLPSTSFGLDSLRKSKLTYKCKLCISMYCKSRFRISGWSRDYQRKPKQVADKKARYWKIRLELLAAYGGFCTCCGETEWKFLTLEHLAGDGKAHRKAAGGARNSWKDLKNRGWPKDKYTLLCWNCNTAKRFGQECPHATQARLLIEKLCR